ncbi:peptidoglycan-binding protein, partial [Patescibacteria group bacterium]|nr:peptidoglycan-binding protein [Patescibacteria group bacterium]
LDSKPTSTVQILLTSTSAQTISTSTIDFTDTNWSTPVTVTVTAVDNAAVDGTHTGTISHVASSTGTGYNAATVISDVTNTVTDNDVAAQTNTGGGGLGAAGGTPLPPLVPVYQVYDPITKTYITLPQPPIELPPEILINPPIVSPPVQPQPPVVPPVPPAKKPYQFKRTMSVGVVGEDVRRLQIILNNAGFTIAKSGPGSKGKETTRFGAATRTALIKFQKAHLKDILGPKAKISQANGVFGSSTMKWVNGGGR